MATPDVVVSRLDRVEAIAPIIGEYAAEADQSGAVPLHSRCHRTHSE